jgi:hypothetical protein
MERLAMLQRLASQRHKAPLAPALSEQWLKENAVKKIALTGRSISVVTLVFPVASEYATVCAPMLSPLYRTENRRFAASLGKTTVATRAR